MNIKHFFDPVTNTFTYVVYDQDTKDGVVIDPVLDFDPPSGNIRDTSTEPVVDYIKNQNIKLHAILETHAHADHLSSSQLLKEIFPQAKIIIGSNITIVQETFKKHLNIDYVKTDASQFDKTLDAFEEIHFGSLIMKAIPTPGHTPACMSYLFGDVVFTGDALFMPDSGTGRCDFPKGSAKDLFNSISKNLYSLPDSTRVFVCHDYGPNGRDIKCETTIGESKKNNIQIKESTSEAEYIKFRETRDKTLSAPRLLLPSIQVNIDAGRLPPIEKNGVAYLKLPLVKKLKLGKL